MVSNVLIRRGAAAVAATLLLGGAWAQQGEQALRSAIKAEVGSNRAAAQSQARIDRLDDQTQELLGEYRVTIRETESLKRYNAQLERLIASQVAEIKAIEDELTRIEETNREVLPMMLRMVNTLEQFVALDLPFLPQERSEDIAELKEIMDRADVTTSEKYRRILEAYKKELDFGRTIEGYEGKLQTTAGEKIVDFLRVGRVALMYQTKDELETGYFDTESRQWKAANDYRDVVKRGLRVAKKQAAPDLLVMPIAAAKEVK